MIVWKYIFAYVLAAALSLLFLAVVFRPLEMAFPAKPGQRFFRPAWFTDLCFFLGQYAAVEHPGVRGPGVVRRMDRRGHPGRLPDQGRRPALAGAGA